MSKLKEKALQASEKFAYQRGYDILDTGYTLSSGGKIDIVAKDGDTIVFIDVLARSNTEKGLPEGDCSHQARRRREMAAIEWMAAHADVEPDSPIRFNNISLVVIAKDRALIRHHVNALGCGCYEEPEPEWEKPESAYATA